MSNDQTDAVGKQTDIEVQTDPRLIGHVERGEDPRRRTDLLERSSGPPSG